MKQLLTRYGFIDIYIEDDVYRISPTFINIAKLGSPKEIIDKFKSLISPTNFVDLMCTAMEVVDCCSSEPLPESYTGSFTTAANGIKYKPGRLIGVDGINDIVVIAGHCLRHGIIGPQSGESSGDPINEFDPYEFIELACEHLGRSVDDASNMTMTQFVRSMHTKFPELKKASNKTSKISTNDQKKLLEMQREMDRKQKEARK